MTTYRDTLEGGARLFRIRRFKRIFGLVLVLMGIALAAIAMSAGGASLKPFFLPLGPLLSIILVVLFLGTLMDMVFRILEIRYAKGDSQRYLIAKNSVRQARPIAVLSLLLGILLLAFSATQTSSASFRDVRMDNVDAYGTSQITVANQDAFGVARNVRGLVELPNGGSAQVTITTPGQPTQDQVIGTVGAQFFFLEDGHREYVITIRNPDSQVIQYRLTILRAIMPELTNVVPGVLLAFAIVNIIWILYARPLLKKYQASSIYSVRYEEAARAGEQTYADYYRHAPQRARPTTGGVWKGAPVARRPPRQAPEPVKSAESAEASEPASSEPEVEPEPEVAEAHSVDRAAGLVDEGSRLFSQGQYEAALALFDEALEARPGHPQALVAGATVLLRLGRRDEALRQYDDALRVDPRNIKALEGRAQLLEENGEWSGAAETWAGYLQLAPNDVRAHVRAAEAILKTGDRTEALRAFEEALALAPSDAAIQTRIDSLKVNVPAVLSRALVESASGKYDESLADFESILRVDPENVNALVGKGVALRRARRLDEALSILNRVLEKQPGNTAALRAKGGILEEREDFEGALRAYEDLLEANPRDADLWALQGGVLEKLGKSGEALASYHEALKLDPTNPDWKDRADELESSRKGQDAFLDELFTIKGVGPARARALLAAGYKTSDEIRSATEEELAKVAGITKALAQEIWRHFHPGRESSPGPEKPTASG